MTILAVILSNWKAVFIRQIKMDSQLTNNRGHRNVSANIIRTVHNLWIRSLFLNPFIRSVTRRIVTITIMLSFTKFPIPKCSGLNAATRTSWIFDKHWLRLRFFRTYSNVQPLIWNVWTLRGVVKSIRYHLIKLSSFVYSMTRHFMNN